jgi:hypothetical protein
MYVACVMCSAMKESSVVVRLIATMTCQQLLAANAVGLKKLVPVLSVSNCTYMLAIISMLYMMAYYEYAQLRSKTRLSSLC